jgi:hypothetical protein
MFVAAAIALALGGIREVGRLNQRRNAYLMQASWHAQAATYHRRLSIVPPTRTDRRIAADQEPTPSPAPIVELTKVIEQEFSLSPERSKLAEEHQRSEEHQRFREAKARQYALSDKRSEIADAYRRTESKKITPSGRNTMQRSHKNTETLHLAHGSKLSPTRPCPSRKR